MNALPQPSQTHPVFDLYSRRLPRATYLPAGEVGLVCVAIETAMAALGWRR
jgi:hypothetical protein